MDSNYELLISKINEFTRKYYLNQLLRGLLYTLGVMMGLYLIFFVLVYYLSPPPFLKTILFFSWLLIVLICIAIGIIKPALAYFRLSKNLTLEQAAQLIGNHFEEVSDKLLNTLQLKALADLSPQQNQLMMAGIDQKIGALQPIPFSRAINFKDNKKYLKYFFIPVAFILVIGLVAPVILREGTNSFIRYDEEILPAAPFSFVLHNKNLVLVQGEDLLLDLGINGERLPQDVYLEDGPNTFKLERKTTSRFNYLFKNLQKTTIFRFSAEGFLSKVFTVSVKPRPAVLNIRAAIFYPAYLKKRNESVPNAGDLLLPEGTKVSWSFYTEHADQLSFSIGRQTHIIPLVNNKASYTSVFSKSETYQAVPKNDFPAHPDVIAHKIDVIPDLPPAISVNEKSDSLSSKAIYFTGNITDDHGFSSLQFVYTLMEGDMEKRTGRTPIPYNPTLQENSFFYFWNLRNLEIKPGQTIKYYIEVADNDGVNGAKKVRSAIKTFAPPTDQQMAKQLNAESTLIKQKMASAIKMAAQVAAESKKLGQSLPDKKSLSFEDKKDISALLDKQKELEKAVKEIQAAKQKNTEQLKENDALKTELAEKQQKIDELFNHVLDAKTKALLEKLQQLMEQNNKDQVQNELSKMSMDNKSLKNELDRVLELYKQLEFEQNLEDKIKRLNALSTAQKELSEKNLKKSIPLDEIKKEQQKLNDDFNAVKKEMKQLSDKNQELEHPNSLSSREKETTAIQEQQKQSMENLEKNLQKKSATQQKQAADQLEQLAKKMEEENQESAQMENNLNAKELRALLQHLLQTSFDQERIMVDFRKITAGDPAYVRNVQQQRNVKDNMRTIADSLSALSKKVPQIESTVTSEVQQINFNIDKSLESLAERRTAEAGRNQQFTMTSINNLALMLNEALEQLEKNKKNAKQGGKGSGKQGMQQLQKMQEQLNKNMQQARQKMQQQGNKGSVPKGTMSEEFAKMAQQQQMIREALQKLNAEENKDGKGSLGNLNELVKDMKLTEADLINKRIEEETIKRQQTLMTKLLDADKASREQDQQEKRESKAGHDFPPSYQKMLEQFKQEKTSEREFIRKLPPSLNYYYKNKIADYFKSLNLPH